MPVEAPWRNCKVYSDLTPKEEEVLILIWEGYFDKEIAQILDISLQTVKNYCSNIYAKWDVNCRMLAVREGLARGILEPVDRREQNVYIHI